MYKLNFTKISQKLSRIETEWEKISPGRIGEFPFPRYKLMIDKSDFAIYRVPKTTESIVAAFHSVVVTKKSILKTEVLTIYPNYTSRILHYKVVFNENNFPGLIRGSKVLNCMLVPFLREVESNRFYKRWRLVVVTDKCQVYHNFPARNVDLDGFECFGDIARFEESAVWDVPGRRYPSNNQNCEQCEIYNPCLPSEAYEYHPSIDVKSKYGNKGFAKSTVVQTESGSTKVSRFYFPTRTSDTCSFFYMGGYEPDYKITVVGTYRSNKKEGVRTVVLATSDGGRNWFAKYEFGDEGEYDFRQGENSWGQNHGNVLDGTRLSAPFLMNAYLQKRSLTHCEDSKFSWGKEIKVKEIQNTVPIMLTCFEPHGLKDGNIIAIHSDDGLNTEWEFLFNNDYSETSSGNGVLYKVIVVDENTVQIFEHVANPDSALACRHIHHINRLRDGWIIGTGEIYPQGWLLFMQMKEADTYSYIHASDYLPIYQLNSSPDSVQRTLGMDVIDSEKPEIIFASDQDLLNRPENMFTRNGMISRNSIGIYKGMLEDIDDFSRFYPIFEAKEPAYMFRKIEGVYLYSGQRGEFALGLNGGNRWVNVALDEPLCHYYGSTYSFSVFDRYLLVIK